MLQEARASAVSDTPDGLAVEKADAEIVLELLDRGGDGRLRDIELDCRLAHLAGIGGGDEIAHLL